MKGLVRKIVDGREGIASNATIVHGESILALIHGANTWTHDHWKLEIYRDCDNFYGEPWKTMYRGERFPV